MANPKANSPRVNRSRPNRPKRTSLSENTVPDSASFDFSFGIGLLLLQEHQEWSPSCLGSWKRLLNSIHELGDYLGFIEAADVLRTEVVTSGSWATAVVNTRKSGLRWMRGLVAALDHSFADTAQLLPGNPQFDVLATFLGWLKRLPVGIPSEEQSEDEYFADDRRLSNVVVQDSPYLVALRGIWQEWFSGFTLSEDFTPRHSSGSTADAGRTRTDKWDRTGLDVVSRVCLRTANLENSTFDPGGRPSRTAKVAFVPKAAGKRRTICMEPAALQYLQHGVAESLIEYTHGPAHPVSKLVDIRSQERNRELCARAYAEDLATIDLTNASDSVSWELIKELTSGLPLCRYLKATRSTLTHIRGYNLRMHKYAPMGSALCFPIECFVFASVVELAYRLHTGKTGAGTRIGCSVYGDDIIVPASLYQTVCEILGSLGFLVNHRKSFCGGCYFESCGVEYTQGWRVQTIRHPRKHLYVEGACHPERIGMITDLANELLALGYLKARRALLKYYLSKDVMLDGDIDVSLSSCIRWGEDGLQTIHDSYSRSYFHSGIQRRVIPYIRVHASEVKGKNDYLDWLSRHPRRSRCKRLADLERKYDLREPVEALSVKAVLHLSVALPAMLYGEDVEVVGRIRTGRLRWGYDVCWYLPSKTHSHSGVRIQPLE